MIKSITIGNFQSFSIPMDLELSRINLLYGANSSGKSALFRVLKLMAQNINETLSRSDGQWTFNSETLHLQSFANCVHKNHLDREMQFSFSFDEKCISKEFRETTEKEFKSSQAIKRKTLSTLSMFERAALLEELKDEELVFLDKKKSSEFDIPLSVSLKLRNPGHISSLTLSVDTFVYPDTGNELGGFSLEFVRDFTQEEPEWSFANQTNKFGDLTQIPLLLDLLGSTTNAFWSRYYSSSLRGSEGDAVFGDLDVQPKSVSVNLEAEKSAYVVFGNRGGIEISGGDSYPAPPEFKDTYRTVERFIQLIWKKFHRLFTNAEFVHPLREIPQLVLDKDSWFHELNTIEPNRASSRASRIALAKQWFNTLTGGEYDFAFTDLSIDGHPTGYAGLLIKNDEYWTNFQNVGVGISQVLPVIFSLFGASASSQSKQILAIEQPELHLHPKFQSELAEAMVAASGLLPGRQIFIETHSENLLLRVLKLIRQSHLDLKLENRLKPSNVSLFFVRKESSGATVEKMLISTSGEVLSKWPVDFVNLRMDELF